MGVTLGCVTEPRGDRGLGWTGLESLSCGGEQLGASRLVQGYVAHLAAAA